jgi:hypothetical protein
MAYKYASLDSMIPFPKITDLEVLGLCNGHQGDQGPKGMGIEGT